jgi:hypothetical protein
MTGFSNPLKRGVPSGVAALSAAGSVLSAVVGESANGNEGFGAGALSANTTGAYSTALGNNALAAQTTANVGGNNEEGNTAVGASAMAALLTGHANVAVGGSALYSGGVGTASDNVAIGCMALEVCQDGTWNVGVGASAMNYFQHPIGCTAVGFKALAGNTNQSLNTGAYNTAIGFEALSACESGATNVALGAGALTLTTSGYSNVACGNNAGQYLTTGQGNVLIGNNAGAVASGQSVVTGGVNVFIGQDAGPGDANDPSICIAIGENTSILNGVRGAVAIGTDHTQTGSVATIQDQFVLGTALHTVKIPGAVSFTPAAFTAGDKYVVYNPTTHLLELSTLGPLS